MDAIFGVLLGLNPAARREARSVRKLEFGSFEAGTSGKVLSTRPTCLKAGGGGFNRCRAFRQARAGKCKVWMFSDVLSVLLDRFVS